MLRSLDPCTSIYHFEKLLSEKKHNFDNNADCFGKIKYVFVNGLLSITMSNISLSVSIINFQISGFQINEYKHTFRVT